MILIYRWEEHRTNHYLTVRDTSQYYNDLAAIIVDRFLPVKVPLTIQIYGNEQNIPQINLVGKILDVDEAKLYLKVYLKQFNIFILSEKQLNLL